MVNFIKIETEFELACAVIDRRAAEAETDVVRRAFSALLEGDTGGRDRILSKHSEVLEAREKSKIEALFRILESNGIDRERAEESYQKYVQNRKH